MLFRAVEWLEITFSDFLLWTVTYSRQSFSLIALLYTTLLLSRFCLCGYCRAHLITERLCLLFEWQLYNTRKNKKWEVFIISRWNIAIMAWSDVWVDNKSAILPHCVAERDGPSKWYSWVIFFVLFNSNRLITTWFAFFSFARSWDDTDTQHRHLVVIVAWNANVHKVPFKKKWGN